MPTIASLNVAISATATQLDAVLRSAGGKISAFAAKANKSVGLANPFGQLLNGANGLGDSLAKVGSKFAPIAAGAVVVDFAAKAMKGLADEAGQAADSFNRGESTLAELGVGLVKSVPILGSVFEATVSVVDATSDLTAATYKYLGANEETIRSLRSRAAIQRQIEADNADLAKYNAAQAARGERVRDLENELALLNTRNEYARELLAIEQERRKLLDEVDKREGVNDGGRQTERDAVIAIKQKQEELVAQKRVDDALQKSIALATKATSQAAQSHAQKLKQLAEEEKARTDAEKRIADAARKEQDKLKADATALVASIATPTEQLARRLGEIDDLLANNAITADSARRAAEQAKEAAGYGPQREVLASVIERGSAAAFANSRRSIDGKKIDEQQLKQLQSIDKTLKARINQPPVVFEVVGSEAL